jgi:DNA gyrase/topoisomerase IV subunit B
MGGRRGSSTRARSSSSSSGGGGGKLEQAAAAASEDSSSGGADAAAGSASSGSGGASSGSSGGSLPPGVSVTRFKGLGEMMPEQLWSTTLNPETRVLRRLTLEDAAAATHTFVTLMGDKVAPRRALIEAEGQRYTLEQLDI